MVNRVRTGSMRGICEYTTGGSPGSYFNPYESVWNLTDICDMREVRWMGQAACKNTDPGVFFDDDTQYTRQHLKALCQSCPVVTECLEWAINNNEQGFWGGLSRKQRKAIVAARALQKQALTA